jgi:hypothetical protein
MVEQSNGGHPLITQMQQVAARAEQASLAELRKSVAAMPVPQQHSPQEGLPFPPGFVGYIADYVYRQAIRPVPEVAIVAALGIMAGIAGREWTTFTNSGLNLYIVLVARSGIGKEALHSGIGAIRAATAVHHPDILLNFDPNEYASGPALIKGIHLNPCLVNVVGEIGHRFLAMSKGKESALASLRKVLTDLYHKSGSKGLVGGISYSNQENNIGPMESVAYSLVGETTPGTFYESISEEMMSDGFMSRFLVVQYEGDRPAENTALLNAPPEALVNWVVGIARQAANLRVRNLFQPVPAAPDAGELLAAFNRECDANIVGEDDERLRQLWSRAHLKALRVATLLAVADNPWAPVVTLPHAEWAMMLVRHGNATFLRRIRTGEVGEGTDGGREQKVLELCREFVTLPADKLPAWLKEGAAMQQNGIVPRKYLQQRTLRIAAFEKHSMGHVATLNMAIKTAMTNGNLMEVKKDKLIDQFGFHGQAYRVLSLT